MDIAKAKLEKIGLEKHIGKLLDEYEKEHGLNLKKIIIKRFPSQKIEVDLEICF